MRYKAYEYIFIIIGLYVCLMAIGLNIMLDRLIDVENKINGNCIVIDNEFYCNERNK